jgi:protein-S-isoprenylcysteine O-methyltransferase Ste14
MRGARVIVIPPPLYYVAGLAAGMALHVATPLPIGGRPTTAVAGAAVLAAGLALVAGGVAGVVRNRTTIVPHHPVSTLVTDGVYRISRNPMYTGLAVVYLGVALLLGSWWPIAFLPVVVLAVLTLVIRPEERYLHERFGTTYADYRTRVHRWI